MILLVYKNLDKIFTGIAFKYFRHINQSKGLRGNQIVLELCSWTNNGFNMNKFSSQEVRDKGLVKYSIICKREIYYLYAQCRFRKSRECFLEDATRTSTLLLPNEENGSVRLFPLALSLLFLPVADWMSFLISNSPRAEFSQRRLGGCPIYEDKEPRVRATFLG